MKSLTEFGMAVVNSARKKPAFMTIVHTLIQNESAVKRLK